TVDHLGLDHGVLGRRLAHGRIRLAHVTRLVDLSLVFDHNGLPDRPGVRRRTGLVRVDPLFWTGHFLSSSSTTSASPTSSPPPGVAPLPASVGPAAPGEVIIVVAFCAAFDSASWDVLIRSMSEPPSAPRRSDRASLTSSFAACGSLSPFSARNFSVCH